MERLVVIIVILIILGSVISCDIMRYRECRRYHPRWYCLSGDNK